MNESCRKLVADSDQLLKEPDKYSFGYAAQRIYDEGYAAGMEMARRLLRLRLGLAVPGDDGE